MSANVGGLLTSPTLPDMNSLRIDDYETLDYKSFHKC
jgi:hypothetical protein